MLHHYVVTRVPVVCASLGLSGTYAEYALAYEDSVLPIPEGWSFNEAAAVPLAAMTAWQVGPQSITSTSCLVFCTTESVSVG
jgi:NADPH:quinone reductase-like Zn-dependent oxidoreductase